MLVYAAPTDNTGRWGIADEAAMTSGVWKLYAQATNAQGALSKTTPQYSVQVNGWFEDLFGQIIEWSIICLVIILLLGAIVFLALVIVHQIRKWRVSSNKEVIELENRLRSDLERIEKELDRKDQVRKKREKTGKD
jgi:beta-lactamase regulating signal transducer with metallopeptidase domain